MDAAGNSFLVNKAAPHDGISDATRIRSGRDQIASSMPAFILPTTNPLGYEPEVGTKRRLFAGMGRFPNKLNLEYRRI